MEQIPVLTEENLSGNVSVCWHILWLRTPAVCTVMSMTVLRCSSYWLEICTESKRKGNYFNLLQYSCIELSCYTPLFILAIPLYIPTHSNGSGSTMSLYQQSVHLWTSAGRIVAGALTRGPKIPDSDWRTHRDWVYPACYHWAQWVRLMLKELEDSIGALGSSLGSKVSRK